MNRKGTVAVAVAMVVLGILMLSSLAMTRMVQTEKIVQGSADWSDRALDAAFSGTQYVTSFAQTGPALFATTAAKAKERLYFTLTPSDVSALWGSISSSQKPAGGSSNLVQSDWMYINQELTYLDEDLSDSKEDEYYFRAVSFPKNDGSNNIDPGYYMVKSQGKFRNKDGGSTVIKDFKCQIIAEVKITVTATIHHFKVNRWRRMDFQDDTNFNKYTSYD